MFADLHIHTYYSDGTQSPEEVAAEAKEKGIGLISVCDHNSIETYEKLKKACDDLNIKCIGGVEIDCRYGDTTLHILAYNCNPNDEAFLALLKENRRILDQMSVDLIEKMSLEYPQITLDDYTSYVRNPHRGGWKGLDYLRSKGFSIVYPDCMKYYGKYNVSLSGDFNDLKTVCDIIHSAGGKAVLAHPGDKLNNEGVHFVNNLRKIHASGIDGIECYYPSHSKRLTNTCIEFCKENDLLITAGSDSHGEFASYVNGVYYALGVIMVDTRELNLKGLI